MIYFGRLVGQTDGESAITLVSEANSYTPLVAASPGSKMLAHGENAIGLAFNRMSGALAANIDYLAGMLDSPALRHDYLEPQNSGGPPTWGFSALKDVAGGSTEISLGAGTYTPTVWLYHGLFQSQVGDWLRLVRVHAEHRADNNEVLPATNVKDHSGGVSVFRTDTEVGSADHRMPNTCAPMREVAPTITPYSNASPSTAIEAWEEDGLRITDTTFQALYVRPGCYLRVFNDNPGNSALGGNGLYQVAHITRSEDVGAAGDKAILTQGGLHKVTVTSVAPYTAGDRVSWKSAPDHAAASSQWERTNFAYVMFIEGLNLYLLPCSGSDDFPVGGVGGVGAGQNIDTLAYAGRFQIGQVGLTTHESGGAQNHSLLETTALYSDVGGTSAEVTNVDYAGTVKRFNIGVAGLDCGLIRVVSPPGFALNPHVQIQVEAAGGDYQLDCRTLTTVREQQQAAGNSSIVAQSENPGDRLGLSMHERTSLLSWLKYTKVGGQLDVVSPSVTSGNRPFGATARVLGEKRWRVTLVNETDATVPADAFTVNNTYLFTHPDAVAAVTACTVLYATTTSVVFSAVNIADEPTNEWPDRSNRSLEPLKAGGFANGSTCATGGAIYRISVIHYRPYLHSDDLGNFIPGIGLNAAYNNDYDSNTTSRFAGAGRHIEMAEDSRPVTYLTTSAVTTKQIHKVMVGAGDVDVVTVSDRATTTVKSLWGHRLAGGLDSVFIGDVNKYLTLTDEARTMLARINWNTDAIAFADLNTGLSNLIPLSDAIYTALPTQGETPSSLLYGIHAATSGTDAGLLSINHGTRVFSDGLIGPKNPVTLPTQTYAADIDQVNGGTITTATPDLSDFVNDGDVVVIVHPDGRKHYATVSALALTTATITPAWPHAAEFAVEMSVIANPFDLDVAECVLSDAGALSRSPLYVFGGALGSLTAPAVAVPGVFETRFVNWTASLNTMAISTAASFTPGVVTLASFLVTDTAVEWIEGFQAPISRLDTKVSITVGDWTTGNNDNARANLKDLAHFATLGEAFRMIAGEDTRATAAIRASRSWDIRIVGPCHENNDPDKNVELPLAVPAHGITIHGAVTQLNSVTSNDVPEITWDDERALLNLNGKEGLTLRDLRVRNRSSSPNSTDTPETVLLSNIDLDGNIDTTVRGLTLDNVHMYGGSAFVWLRDVVDGDSVSFRDCSIRETVTAGILFDGNGAGVFKDLAIENFYMTKKAGAFNSDILGIGGLYGIKVTNAERAIIKNVVLVDVPGKGVKVDNVSLAATFEDIYVSGSLDTAFQFGNTVSLGIYRATNCLGVIAG